MNRRTITAAPVEGERIRVEEGGEKFQAGMGRELLVGSKGEGKGKKTRNSVVK